MSKTYKPYDPDQSLLLPPSIREWLGEDHLALFVSDIVDTLDLRAIFAVYEAEERGQPPYHPAMMVKVLVYGYCVGTRSSRRISKAMRDEIPFRVLGAGNFPDHRTVSDFRKIHLAAFADLFKQVLRLAYASGLVKVGTIAIDGTKMRANASMAKNRKHDALAAEEQLLKAEIERILHEAERIDEEEDSLYGPEKRGDELPPGLRSKKERLARIQEAKKQIEDEITREHAEFKEHLAWREREEERMGRKLIGRKPHPPTRSLEDVGRRNTTDPDSRIMKTWQEFVQSYNAQASVDIESGFILGAFVTQDVSDQRQLNRHLDEVRENLGVLPELALADAGFWKNEEVLTAPPGVELLIAAINSKEQRKREDEPSPRGRIPERLTLRQRMDRILRTERGKRLYKLRSQTIEPTFGQIKEGRGIRRFLLRGKPKVDGEWQLVTLGHNVLKFWRPQTG